MPENRWSWFPLGGGVSDWEKTTFYTFEILSHGNELPIRNDTKIMISFFKKGWWEWHDKGREEKPRVLSFGCSQSKADPTWFMVRWLSFLLYGFFPQPCSQRLGEWVFCKVSAPNRDFHTFGFTGFPFKGGTIDPLGRGQAVLILGREHVLYLRKLCTLHSFAVQNPGGKKRASPSHNIRGREKERWRGKEDSRRGKERTKGSNWVSINERMLCHGVPIQRNVPHHVAVMQKEEVIVGAQLLTTVHSSCIYGCALCWEHGVSNRTLEERHQPGFGKKWRGLPHLESSTGKRGWDWGAGLHLGMCPYSSYYLTAVIICGHHHRQQSCI